MRTLTQVYTSVCTMKSVLWQIPKYHRRLRICLKLVLVRNKQLSEHNCKRSLPLIVRRVEHRKIHHICAASISKGGGRLSARFTFFIRVEIRGNAGRDNEEATMSIHTLSSPYHHVLSAQMIVYRNLL